MGVFSLRNLFRIHILDGVKPTPKNHRRYSMVHFGVGIFMIKILDTD